MRTIQVTIDEPLLLRLDEQARCDKVARALFIRRAVEQRLDRLDLEEKLRKHQDAYAHPSPNESEEWPDEDWPTASRTWDDL